MDLINMRKLEGPIRVAYNHPLDVPASKIPQAFSPLVATHAPLRTALFKAPGGERGGGLEANMASAAVWEIAGVLRTVR